MNNGRNKEYLSKEIRNTSWCHAKLHEYEYTDEEIKRMDWGKVKKLPEAAVKVILNHPALIQIIAKYDAEDVAFMSLIFNAESDKPIFKCDYYMAPNRFHFIARLETSKLSPKVKPTYEVFLKSKAFAALSEDLQRQITRALPSKISKESDISEIIDNWVSIASHSAS